MRKIILASTSPRRHELMHLLGLPFEIVSSDYEEDMTLKITPQKLVKVLSAGKAADVASKHKHSLVIGADTIVVYNNEVLGKPHTPAKAKEMLKKLSGQTHSVFTGFTIIDDKTKKSVSCAIESKVYFRKLSDKEISDYVKTGVALKKAGAYGINDRASLFTEKIEGDYFNIVGFPVFHIAQELKKFGINC